MLWFEDVSKRQVRFSDERRQHIESDHPEMAGQASKLKETISSPDVIIRSKTDSEVELFYRRYSTTPVTDKYLCVVIKSKLEDVFIITAYFTDSIKRGQTIWEKK